MQCHGDTAVEFARNGDFGQVVSVSPQQFDAGGYVLLCLQYIDKPLTQQKPASVTAYFCYQIPALLFLAEPHDVCLSSGFLAFAQHSGFLQAVEEVSFNVHLPCDVPGCLVDTTRPLECGGTASLMCTVGFVYALFISSIAGGDPCCWCDGHQRWRAYRQLVCSRLHP